MIMVEIPFSGGSIRELVLCVKEQRFTELPHLSLDTKLPSLYIYASESKFYRFAEM